MHLLLFKFNIGSAGQQTYRAIVLINPTTTATATTTTNTTILPKSSQLNAHNSVNFRARTLKFCMEVDIDIS